MGDRVGGGKEASGSLEAPQVRVAANPTLVEVFAALGDPNRQRIIELLSYQGSATSSALAKPLGVTRQGAEKHLAILSHAKLVSSQRSGREVLYALRTDEFATSSEWLKRIAANWDRRLEAIKRLAEE